MSFRSRAALAVLALGLVATTAPAFADSAPPVKKTVVHHKKYVKKVKATKPVAPAATPAPIAAAKP